MISETIDSHVKQMVGFGFVLAEIMKGTILVMVKDKY